MNWLGLSHFGEKSPAHHLYQICQDAPPDWVDLEGAIHWRWSRMMPGGFALPHIDCGPHRRRMQWPVEPAGKWWDPVRGTIDMPSEPFQVRQWEPHALWNNTSTPRVVIYADYDRDVILSDLVAAEACRWDPADFPELAELVEATHGF